jgi:bifunctional non-homologous end joining protein LigD
METTVNNELNALLKSVPRSTIPAAIEPVKATLVNAPFDAPGWCYETKWDGYRALAVVQNGEARLISRNHTPFDRFYSVIRQLANWKVKAVIDGEIVVLNHQGVSYFGAKQNSHSPADGQLVYEVFDVLWYEDRNLTNLPLAKRQPVLKLVLPQSGSPIRLRGSGNQWHGFFPRCRKAGTERDHRQKGGKQVFTRYPVP